MVRSEPDRSAAAAAVKVDVIIPVHGGEAWVRRCLATVLAPGAGWPHEVVVVDDASPQASLVAWLDELAAEGRICLLRNAHNRGFTASVNRALCLHPERDVVLLNSDTEVAGDWLARLLRCAGRYPRAATLTPWSNNATICSYPHEGWAGELPGSLGLAALDALCAKTLAGVAAELPTGVGFCMYMRRACIDEIGLLDELAFPRGYGEENDFCRRALKAGWHNLLCADVLVYHCGGVSFGSERAALMAAGSAALTALHPEYAQAVERFIAADPLLGLRRRLDEARRRCGGDEPAALAAEQAVRPPRLPALPPLQAPAHSFAGMQQRLLNAQLLPVPVPPSTPAWLHVVHGWGGGTERWVEDFAVSDVAARHFCLRSCSGRNAAGVRLELLEPARSVEVLLAWDLPQPIATCAIDDEAWLAVFDSVLRACDIEVVVVSSLIGHSLDALRSRCATVLVLHDLFPFCPALFGSFGEVCTMCTSSRLTRCLTENPFNVFWHHPQPEPWQALRAAYAQAVLTGGVQVVAPTASMAARWRQLQPELTGWEVAIIGHGLRFLPLPLPATRLPVAGDGQRRLRLLIPGRLSPHKGLALLREVLPALADESEVLLLGCGEFGREFAALPHVHTIEHYQPAQLAVEVAAFAPDCALLPALLPESFSYTLSEMEALGLPVVATGLGAFAERIEDGRSGWLVAPEPAAIVARLRACAAAPQTLQAAAAVVRARRPRTAAQMAADYHHLLVAAPPRQSKMRSEVGFQEAATPVSPLLEQAFASLSEACSRLRHRQEEVAAVHAGWQQADRGWGARLGALAGALERAEAGRQAMSGRIVELEAEVNALRTSTSWRLTAPVRALVQTVRSWRRRLLRGTAAAKMSGTQVAAAKTAARSAVTTAPTTAPTPAPGTVLAVDRAFGPATDRATARRDCREALGLADATLLVVGGGGEADQADFAGFVELAAQLAAWRNGIVCLWLATEASLPALLAGEALEPGPGACLHGLLAQRRLLVRADLPVGQCLLAADVALSGSAVAGADAWPFTADLLPSDLPKIEAGSDAQATLAALQRVLSEGVPSMGSEAGDEPGAVGDEGIIAAGQQE